MARTANAGLTLAIISAATFGAAGTFATSLIDAGWTPLAAVTARIGVAALVLTIPAAWQLRGHWTTLRTNARTLVPFGLLAVAGAQLFFFNAVEHVSVGVALLLEYSGILLVVVWMWARHGQRPGRVTVVGGVLALAGMVLVLDLTGAQHVDLVGVLWGLGAALGLATYYVTSAKADDALPPLVTTWAGMVIAWLGLVLAAVCHVLPFRATAAQTQLAGWHVSWIVPVLGVSLVATVAAYVTGVAAARRLGARLASFIGMAEVLSAVLIASGALGQRLDAAQLVGGVVVLIGIASVRAGEPAEPRPVDTGEPVELPA